LERPGCSLAVEGTSILAETYAFLDVSIETAARPLELKRFKVVFVHVDMAESLIDDNLAALGLDPLTVLTTTKSAVVIYPEIEASGCSRNCDSGRSLLMGRDVYSECEKGAHEEDTTVGSPYNLFYQDAHSDV
jgi:hypothetical protein